MLLLSRLVRVTPGGAVASLFLLLACPAAHSQTALYTLDGDSAEDWFGISVSGAGDVNGDGLDDLIGWRVWLVLRLRWR